MMLKDAPVEISGWHTSPEKRCCRVVRFKIDGGVDRIGSTLNEFRFIGINREPNVAEECHRVGREERRRRITVNTM